MNSRYDILGRAGSRPRLRPRPHLVSRLFVRAIALAVFSVALLIGGCAASPSDFRPAQVHVSPSLVTMPSGEHLSQPGWEYARNDQYLASPRTPDRGGMALIEIRHREHLRTINGRPREYSTTRRRSIQWGQSW